jgi:hypothetical protein
MDAAIRFDPSRFRVSNVRAAGLAAGFAVASNVDNVTGTIRLAAYTGGGGVPLAFGTDGVVITFDLTVLKTAKPGSSSLNLLQSLGTTITGAGGPTGQMVLSPAPTDAATDPVDAQFVVLALAPKSTAVSHGVGGAAPVSITWAGRVTRGPVDRVTSPDRGRAEAGDVVMSTAGLPAFAPPVELWDEDPLVLPESVKLGRVRV